MSGDAWLTIAVLVAMVAALATSRVSPPAGVIGASALLFVLGVTDAAEAFGGFSNPAPITVAGLYVVAAAVDRTGAIQPLVRTLLGKPNGDRRDLARLAIPSAAASAFLANTPIVAMLVPAVTRWADREKRSASTFLIPLSYATILGGSLTVIGTSTNLVMSGLIEQSGQEPLGLFELATVGAPIAIVGLIIVVLLGPSVLPQRVRPGVGGDAQRPFTVSMSVVPDGAVDGTTVAEAGLRNLAGVFLVEIDRGGKLIAPVQPTQTLRGGDRLVFAGSVDDVVDLQGRRGLEVAIDTDNLAASDQANTAFYEVVLGASSPLVGRTVAAMDFRARYDAAVLAIHRSGTIVRGKIGTTPLRSGDTLLVLASKDFRIRWRDAGEFLLVSRVDAPMPTRTDRSFVALAALAAAVVLPALGWLSVTRAVIGSAIVAVLVGVLRPREARDAVDVNVVLMIGGAFGLGAAVEASGLGGRIADLVLDGSAWAGTYGAVVGLVIATIVLTELITNAAAVALIFPIANQVASEVDVDPRVLLIGVAVAGSASFLTPIGYQTNTMVYGPGGYRFSDYLRLGVPLSALVVLGVPAVVLAS